MQPHRPAKQTEQFDLFICHASEDKNVVRPLVALLKARGLSVWLDELQLTLGDSLNGRIEAGLAHSRFGVVVISPSFPTKAWTQRELAGLVAKEVTGGVKVILPVWHEVDVDYVAEHFPVLADRLGAPTSKGVIWVSEQIELALKTEESGRPNLTPPPNSRSGVTQALKRRMSGGRLGGFGLLSIAAAAIAFAATPGRPRASASTSLPNSVSTPDLEMSLPSGWRRTPRLPSIPGIQLVAPLALRSIKTGDSLVVGTGQSSSPTLLPETLLRSLARAPHGEAVRIGAMSFYRYRDLRPGGPGSGENVYAQPTTSGILLGVCQVDSDVSRSATVTDCEEMLGSITLLRASSMSLGPQLPYAIALNKALSQLNAARQLSGRRLADAGTPGKQADAARELAAAHDQAAESLRTATPGPAEGNANRGVIRGLERLSAGYRSLAEAAQGGDRQSLRAPGSP